MIEFPIAPVAPNPAGVTVVVPALNEERGIVETLSALKEAVARVPGKSEIVVVDDGSRDRTAALAREHGARVISHPQQGGYGKALRTGILQAKYETIVITDADGTYPVEEIPTLVELLPDFDMVVGARTGKYFRRKAFLSPLRTMFLLLSAWVTGTRIPDPNSGLRAFRRSDAIPLLPRLPRGFSFTTTITLILTLSGRFIHYRPVAYHRRIGRSKVRLVRDALRVGQTMVEVVLTHNPLKMFLIVAIPLGLAAVLCALLAFVVPTAIWAALILLSLAILVFSLGMHAVVVLDERRLR